VTPPDANGVSSHSYCTLLCFRTGLTGEPIQHLVFDALLLFVISSLLQALILVRWNEIFSIDLKMDEHRKGANTSLLVLQNDDHTVFLCIDDTCSEKARSRTRVIRTAQNTNWRMNQSRQRYCLPPPARQCDRSQNAFEKERPAQEVLYKWRTRERVNNKQ
jgi:hypothetical protein